MITPNTTIGTELEFYRIGTAATEGLQHWLRFHVHNDGSLRDVTYTAGNIAIYPEEDEQGAPILSVGMRAQSPYGLEIITDPYTIAEFMPLSKKIAYFFGQIPQSARTSIHVHVDAHNETWRELQNLLRWSRALEAIIYRLACGGGKHRGARNYQGQPNDYKFCRPLSAPIGVEWSTGRREPLILWNNIIHAQTASEFMAAWGRLDLFWSMGLEHYMPHRLHMINISSILRTGTIEWRVFDGLYSYFDVLVELVCHIHVLAGKMQAPDFEFDLGSSPGVDAKWVSDLLDMDVSMLWGSNWQVSCQQHAPYSHYPSQPVLRVLGSGNAPNRIHNGLIHDDYSPEFVPYVRGAR